MELFPSKLNVQTSGINETKHVVFEKTDNINKCPAGLSRKKEGKNT